MVKDKRGFEVDYNTKGNSVPNPERYKGDVMTQVWLDSRMLATLSKWLDKDDMITRFLSDVIRESMEILVDIVTFDDPELLVDDTDKARFMLSNKYRINLNVKGRGERNLAHNRMLSERRRETAEKVKKRRIANKIAGVKDVDSPMNEVEIDKDVQRALDDHAALERIDSVEEDKMPKDWNFPHAKPIGYEALYAGKEPDKDTSEIMPTVEETRKEQDEEAEQSEQTSEEMKELLEVDKPESKAKGDTLKKKTKAELDKDEEERKARDKELAEGEW